QILKRQNPYAQLEARARGLLDGLEAEAKAAGVPFSTTLVGAMFGLFFRAQAPKNYDEAKTADTAAFTRFFGSMLSQGVYLAPSAFEAAFISTAHDESAIAATLSAARAAFAAAAEH